MTLHDWTERLHKGNRSMTEATVAEAAQALDIIADDLMHKRTTMAHADVLLALSYALKTPSARASELASLESAAAKMGSARTDRKAGASRANGAKGGRPTEAERAERRAFYERMAEESHKAPVVRKIVKDLRGYKRHQIEQWTGHQVVKCSQSYLTPADSSRAERGLETGLITAERHWIEVDGVRQP